MVVYITVIEEAIVYFLVWNSSVRYTPGSVIVWILDTRTSIITTAFCLGMVMPTSELKHLISINFTYWFAYF